MTVFLLAIAIWYLKIHSGSLCRPHQPLCDNVADQGPGNTKRMTPGITLQQIPKTAPNNEENNVTYYNVFTNRTNWIFFTIFFEQTLTKILMVHCCASARKVKIESSCLSFSRISYTQTNRTKNYNNHQVLEIFRGHLCVNKKMLWKKNVSK